MKQKEIQFVEDLLRYYKGMNAERCNLNIKWNMLEREKRDAIEGEFVKASTLTDMPKTPIDGYKEYRLLISKSWDKTEIEDEQSFVTERIKDLEDIITIIESSLNSLGQEDKDIVIFYYINRFSLEKISQIVHSCHENVCRKKYRALRYLYKSLRILEGTVIFR